ncbi:MAG: DUF1080 domain-containing protein [Planctomycetota bacterium]|nr:DUF1080 domain-containing protein [Planctomycetota bacterium]
MTAFNRCLGAWWLVAVIFGLLVESTAAETLFDGQSFAGWEGDTTGVWRIEDGQIVAGSLDRRQEKNDFLCTTRRFGNFDLRLQIRLVGTDGFVNSGIQFRSARIPNSHEVIGYQADFGKGYDGALYDESRRRRMLAQPAAEVLAKISRPGEWHDYRIRAEGARVQLWVNGIQTVDYTETEPGLPADGVIALQIHGNAISEVRFKDLSIEELPPSVAAIECRPRDGLPNFFAKARSGEEICVAYFGGSITAAPGWRVGSLDRLRKAFPQASFREINAAIGGTGSDLGAFRVGRDVLARKPDLVFIEFAVNDGAASAAQIQATMEGIVRQIRRAAPTTDMCFVYTVSEPVFADLCAGFFQRSASAMEGVADHYGIPSVHFGVAVAEQARAGALVFKGDKMTPFDPAAKPMLFSTDGVHPLVETGHVLYADVLARSLESMTTVGPAARPHGLPGPLRADHWEEARMVPITATMLSGSWTDAAAGADKQARTFQSKLPVLWKASAAGASLRFAVTVPGSPGDRPRRTAVYDLLGPGGGMVEIRVDGEQPRTVPRIDGYCTYWRLATLPLGDLSPGTHEVEVRLLADAPMKETILFEKNRADMVRSPAKYAPNIWYASSLLVFGEVKAIER